MFNTFVVYFCCLVFLFTYIAYFCCLRLLFTFLSFVVYFCCLLLLFTFVVHFGCLLLLFSFVVYFCCLVLLFTFDVYFCCLVLLFNLVVYFPWQFIRKPKGNHRKWIEIPTGSWWSWIDGNEIQLKLLRKLKETSLAKWLKFRRNASKVGRRFLHNSYENL